MDLRVHGWVSAEKPVVGFWQINPSTEFRIGGPFKQELSSHAGPTTLAMFGSTHYVGPEMLTKFEKGEKWKKVFGPVFLYMNTVADGKDIPLQLWEDAKRQMMVETESWPYNFPASEDFPKAHNRGKVVGRLIVRDRYIAKDLIIAGGAYVGLASPGDTGSWQLEAKAYQFWTRADEKGYFSINNIRKGEYNIYASVPGFIGDYRNDAVITITSGSEINVGNLLFKPPRAGPTLWEIGIPDRSGAEFYIPNPDPKYYNKFLDLPGSKFRQHGLWERYIELYPHGDLVFKIGESDYQKDWFFAQVTRKNVDNTYQGTSWQIQFRVDKIIHRAAYKLWVAIAAANYANLQVLVNNQTSRHPLFSSGRLGRDNVIARHGIHGLYQLFGLDIPASLLVEGINTFFFNQPKKDNMFVGIIYDYIRLEGPFLPK